MSHGSRHFGSWGTLREPPTEPVCAGCDGGLEHPDDELCATCLRRREEDQDTMQNAISTVSRRIAVDELFSGDAESEAAYNRAAGIQNQLENEGDELTRRHLLLGLLAREAK